MRQPVFCLLSVFFSALLLEAAVVQLPLRKQPIKTADLQERAAFYSKAKASFNRHVNPKFAASNAAKRHRFPMLSYKNDYFVTEVSLGTPPQNFIVAIDELEAQFWVLDRSYKGSTLPSQHLYDAEKSTTSQLIDDEYEGIYLEGSALGFTINDTLQLQGLAYDGQSFGSIQTLSDEFGQWSVDGLFGFGDIGPDEFGEYPYDNPLYNVASQLDESTYTLWLSRQNVPQQGFLNGALTLGGFDSAHCDANVVSQEELFYFFAYVIEVDGISIGAYSKEQEYLGMVNIGMPFVSLPTAELNVVQKVGEF
ncbi:Asp-1 [Aphelenchoides fujianensis]|nr:Asp-1 [Aphelenchoides fujianensis]